VKKKNREAEGVEACLMQSTPAGDLRHARSGLSMMACLLVEAERRHHVE